MDIDFAFWLVLATAVTGAIVLLDVAWLRTRRAAGAAESWPVEYSHSFFPVLALVLVLRSFLAEPFTIPSGSMLPTLEVGDYIVVNKFAYGLRLPVLGTRIVDIGEPQRGDIMVFRYPVHPSTSFIKRVVGLPGDRIAYRGGSVYINDTEVAKTFVARHVLIEGGAELLYTEQLGSRQFTLRRVEGRPEPFGPSWETVVPAGHYFVMGDNRDNSVDSRAWGFVPDRLIVGKAFYIWMHKAPGLHLPTFARNGTTYRLAVDTAGEKQ